MTLLKVRYCNNRQKQVEEIKPLVDEYKGDVVFEEVDNCWDQKTAIYDMEQEEQLDEFHGVQSREVIEGAILAYDESLDSSSERQDDETNVHPDINCPECGTPTTKEANFCSNCGHDLT